MQRRKLEELNLLDDFLFGSMVTYPEIGEKFIREILRIIFKRDFGKLTVVPQKSRERDSRIASLYGTHHRGKCQE